MADLDVEAFRRDGCLELGPTLGEEDRAAVMRYFDTLGGLARISPGYQAQYDGEGPSRRLRKARRLFWNDREFFTPILRRLGAADLAEQLIGPTAALILHAAFLKPAQVGTAVAPHQDQGLWETDHPGAFSLWVALTDVTPDNGGLHGHPGSHTHGVLPHHDDPGHPWHGSVSHLVDGLGPRREFVLAPGEAVIWDRMFVHASGPNTSAHDRRGMVLVFADTAADGFHSRDALPLAALRAATRHAP